MAESRAKASNQSQAVDEVVEETPSENLESKEAQALQIVSKYTGWGAGAGVIPFPVWDVVAIGGVQIVMLKELFELYGVPFSETKARSVVSVLLGSISPTLLAGVTAATLFKVVPVVGHALAALSLPILASAATYAVGKVMTDHLEQGGTLEDFDAKAAKKEFNDNLEEGKQAAKAAVKGTA
ncbi:YcjF family protein [Algicola sagamiensis]|uniref:YcjF family protein n=1 Tax=Algicola sagamiensis TaxID=163869 RepID=UPI00036892DC|nr:DUF697 domain-containing protein [Algicola sagamiensis]